MIHIFIIYMLYLVILSKFVTFITSKFLWRKEIFDTLSVIGSLSLTHWHCVWNSFTFFRGVYLHFSSVVMQRKFPKMEIFASMQKSPFSGIFLHHDTYVDLVLSTMFTCFCYCPWYAPWRVVSASVCDCWVYIDNMYNNLNKTLYILKRMGDVFVVSGKKNQTKTCHHPTHCGLVI